MMIVKQAMYMIGLLLLGSLGSCSNPGTKDMTTNSNSINNEQSKVGDVKIQEAWEDKTKGLNKQLKDYSVQKLAALQSLLAQVPEQQVKTEFEKIVLSPVGYSDLNEFEQTFVQVSVMSNVSAQDRPALVALLSSKCPAFIGGEPIELYLSHSSIPDPLLVLFDSYDGTTNVHTRKDLLSILDHAFRNIRDKSTGDDEFVSRSKEWYLQNKGKFELNPYYHPDSPFPQNQELFVVKSKPQNPD